MMIDGSGGNSLFRNWGNQLPKRDIFIMVSPAANPGDEPFQGHIKQ